MSLLVDRILETFAPREREVLSLYLGGVPTSEIVDIFHTERYQNIVNWLHRGRKKLARELAKFGYAKPGPNRGR
jgi:DNA-directed RNA polymerase specialized sigma24 family protein